MLPVLAKDFLLNAFDFHVRLWKKLLQTAEDFRKRNQSISMQDKINPKKEEDGTDSKKPGLCLDSI